MPEVSLTQASEIVAKDRTTVFRWVEDGLLPARRVGVRRDIFIDIEVLRSFADRYSYRFDDTLARQYAQ
jgi:predicted DNA-binding transcriptional regulator AlpA